jgi:predicted ATPase/DNA-binding SARP family transcriptional activator
MMERLTLSLLGPLRITLDSTPVAGFAYDKVRALLIYLAVEAAHPHSRDALAALLWPDMPGQAARTNLRQVLTTLRQAIGDESARPPFLLTTRETIQFNPASDHAMDLTAFKSLLVACETHIHRGMDTCRSCAWRRKEAIMLYRGEFLARFHIEDSAEYEEWAVLTRERLHQQALGALAGLTAYHERCGNFGDAQQFARRQIELDPWNEEAHQQLIRVLWLTGQRGAALAQYERCRQLLEAELGIEPAPETTALYERIRDGTTSEEQGLSDEVAAARGNAHTGKLQPIRNVPAPTTALIGRETDLVELGDLLENPACRLLTLVGEGGIGKTRLALAAAAEQAGGFADGAAFVPLAGISATQFVAPAILAALDVPQQGQRDPCDQLVEYLRGKKLLLVLDNVEQLLVSAPEQQTSIADVLAELQGRAPGLTLLVTSRERLALPGEWLFYVAGLSYPPGEPGADVKGYSAMELFVQRARQLRRPFTLTDGEAHAVARICRVVDGLPLAIELAAAAVRTRTCTAIAAAIEGNLSALTAELRGVPERHRSMWATFEHSWHLLSDEERQIFPRLAVFRGGFEEQVAVQIARAVPDRLAALLDKSLLRWDGVGRYDMHELVRQYASEKLEQAGEAADTRRRHARYFLALAETAEGELRRGVAQVMWSARLEAEHDNLRVALQWALDQRETDLAIRLSTALELFWLHRGYPDEGRRWLVAALDACACGPAVRPDLRAKALLATSHIADQLGDWVRGVALYEEALPIFRELGDKSGIAAVLGGLAAHAHRQGDYRRAAELSETQVALERELGNRWGIASALGDLGYFTFELGNVEQGVALLEESLALRRVLEDKVAVTWAVFSLGVVAYHWGDFPQAAGWLEESLALAQELGDIRQIALVHMTLGSVAGYQGNVEQATRLLQESLETFEKLGDRASISVTLRYQGKVAHDQHDWARATALYQESLSQSWNRRMLWEVAACLEGLAGVAGEQDRPRRAARLWAVAAAIRERMGALLPRAEHSRYATAVSHARATLGDDAFDTAWAEGQAMTLEQAIAYALDDADS